MLRSTLSPLRPALTGMFQRNASSVATMTLIGRITQPQTATTQAGKEFLSYSVAVQPKRDGPTSWFEVGVFSENQIKFINDYVNKGSLVQVTCDASRSVYEREDGSKASSLRLFQKEINVLVFKNVEEASEEQ
ncbi:hypothetical protein BABINDRAFT_162850 [Babjeviella inositovora NRRL Y-12698]|uniref:Single-stranded DNA-binding protein n=1 Tax=Babjeviella inositovora NRRL Y-12698 TaxID=984486 RepID=A0A1E3QKN5_9ASCO|nr:uncharacterized protein BABINDRAFT_162850 [Babjeviella inositovora NRRL Y-12698]ODQ78178.1 hypothetical protein BABINDRAFT_162850 [Babjeviella inositovora NRRL Y-12698]